jgi:hypothetical protein
VLTGTYLATQEVRLACLVHTAVQHTDSFRRKEQRILASAAKYFLPRGAVSCACHSLRLDSALWTEKPVHHVHARAKASTITDIFLIKSMLTVDANRAAPTGVLPKHNPPPTHHYPGAEPQTPRPRYPATKSGNFTSHQQAN